MGFSRQEYWNGLPFPTPWGLPDPEIESASPVSPTWAGGFFSTAPPRKAQVLELGIGKRQRKLEAGTERAGDLTQTGRQRGKSWSEGLKEVKARPCMACAVSRVARGRGRGKSERTELS